jgi:hypothetical protein
MVPTDLTIPEARDSGAPADHPELIDANSDADELPEVGLEVKGVREWLRDAEVDEALPAHFNDLVSIATHTTSRPYINKTGTWPEIVTKWVPYAWEHGFHAAATRLITCALYNTNATADQDVWPGMIRKASPAARSAWNAAMPSVLRNGFFEIGKRESNFTKNFRSVISDPSVWFNPGLIAAWTDDEVLGIATEDKRHAKMVGSILAGWLAPEDTLASRLVTWRAFYNKLASTDPARVSGFLHNVAIASSTLDEATTVAIYEELRSEHAYCLLRHLATLASDPPIPHSVWHPQYVLGYTSMAKAPFSFSLDGMNKLSDAAFIPLRSPDVWQALDSTTKKAMACLSLSTLAVYRASWRDWFRSVAVDAGLSLDLPTLLDTMQDSPGDFSWAQLVAIHAAHTDVALPDLELGH